MSAFLVWLKRLFGGHRPATETEMVPFRDANGHIGQIPVSQLQPGMIQVQCGREGPVVWAWARDFQPGEVRHPPFEEPVRVYIRKIQAAFAEHRLLSFEEWEEGFRRDLYPLEEIGLWCHAADVYKAFADKERAPERRKEIYDVILACLTATPDTFWRVLELDVLTRSEAEEIAKRVYGKHYPGW